MPHSDELARSGYHKILSDEHAPADLTITDLDETVLYGINAEQVDHIIEALQETKEKFEDK